MSDETPAEVNARALDMVTEVTDQKGILLSKFDVGVLVDAVQQDLCAEVLRAGVRAVKDAEGGDFFKVLYGRSGMAAGTAN
jgi:hypothetical protein